MKLDMSVVIEVMDAEALTRDAIAEISTTEFGGRPGRTPEQERDEYIAEVTRDLAIAVRWHADPMATIDHPGAVLVESSCGAVELDEDGVPLVKGPNFDALFEVCHCAKQGCERCEDFQVTPRTADALHNALTYQADLAYDDVLEHGDDPVDDDFWNLFDEYPRITHRQDALWRRQAARAFDDLAADLAQGHWPHPHCPAEEMALHLALRWAESALTDGIITPYQSTTEPHRDDHDWGMLLEVLVQDTDILNLFHVDIDGIEDPTSEPNQFIGMGDYRPAAWFTASTTWTAATPDAPSDADLDGTRPFFPQPPCATEECLVPAFPPTADGLAGAVPSVRCPGNMDPLTPGQRTLRAQIAAHTSSQNTEDRVARSAPARQAALDRFDKQVDPDGTLPIAERIRRAQSARRAYFRALALKSSTWVKRTQAVPTVWSS
ncbi:hypothetical protein UO65_5446 [Actinokineospora spheciospongiae]|uniref:Uncharacterized protein n=1 Tax=Actinokineospora spheciospongiae TaxID=909613 RepID=W7IZ20_9PSEU|nr:hypothetical protein UO65_5446 [Actinokineospora spheciospongiae]